MTISLVPEAKGGPFVLWGDLAGNCAKAAEFGFDGVEIFARAAEELNARQLRGLLQQHNLKLAAMGTGAGWVVHKLRLTDPDPMVRQRARDFVAGIVDLAAAFGSPAIVGSMQGRSDENSTRNQAIGWLSEALESLGPRAHAAGVPLLFEPLNRYETNLINTVADALELLQSLRTKNVRLLCDLFHMNIEEPNIADSLRRAGPMVGHVHLADSNRRALGWGHTELSPIIGALSEIGFSGWASAEALPLPDSDSAARQTALIFQQFFSGESNQC
ncbi:MAG: sugar phosphate isomerase/epimerase [Verrucomicrobiales bacterium]|nr:sugar phosphate isomerase/epimerase [Verrucomicrobiales bacterium]